MGSPRCILVIRQVNAIAVCLAALWNAIPSFSQDSLTNDILTTRVFRKGIYRFADEFRTNSPGETGEFTVKYDTGKYERFILYQKGKKVRYMYGFSDGKAVYLNAKVYGQTNYFVRILVLGPISYLEDARAKESEYFEGAMSTAFAGGVVGGAVIGALAGAAAFDYGITNPGWVIYLPDTDGKAYALDRTTMESIMTEANPELLKKFDAEEKKSKKSHQLLMKYLLEFNQRALAKQGVSQK
ncbi:MAG: hypothetical protein JNL40_01290 [Cyclobacteriaceae bacterium]|nr:hypothetical protein [Cyclobacteriaceae bacterium]